MRKQVRDPRAALMERALGLRVVITTPIRFDVKARRGVTPATIASYAERHPRQHLWVTVVKLGSKVPREDIRNSRVQLWIAMQSSCYFIGEGHVSTETRQAGPK